MGVRGNIARVLQGVEAVLCEAGLPSENTWYFPSLGEYARLLENYGFEILHAETFPRWNKLEHPERGLREWLEMFGSVYFENIPQTRREALIMAIETRLRPVLFRDGAWWADYRRLRIVGQAG
jgi:trans-aconitate 2-methyltransferase